MDKLIRDADRNITVSNDGATLLKLLPVFHPVAHILVDTCISHDKEVGDGTTGVVLLTSSLLNCASELLRHVNLQEIIRGFEYGLELVLDQIEVLGKPSSQDSIFNAATTSLNSKVLKPHSSFFVDLLKKVMELVPQLEMAQLRIVKVPGADLRHSYVLDGVMFPPTFSYAGANQQSQFMENPKILFLDHEVEHKHQKEHAQAVINDPGEYNDFVKAEWDLVFSNLERIVATGCNIVLNLQATGDVATQYFAERGIVCISRIDLSTLQLLASSTDGSIQRSLLYLPTTNQTIREREHTSSTVSQVLGTSKTYKVQTIGSQSYHVFSGCSAVATLVLRGGTSAVLGEAERSLIDALHAMRSIIGQQKIVPGGGATEMSLCAYIKRKAAGQAGKRRLVLESFGQALVDLPQILAENCGFDSPKIIAELTHVHHHNEVPNYECYGIDVNTGGICDTLACGVVEGLQAKRKAIVTAVESACMILSVDRIILAPD